MSRRTLGQDVLGLGRSIVGCGHVSACVVLLVGFFSTGSWVFLALSGVAALFAWWLLREDAS